MGFNDSSDIYSLLRNHISVYRYIHDGPLLFGSSFIIYSLSSDPSRLYTKEYSNCPKNIVIYTTKYTQYIFYIDTHTHNISCKPQHFLTKKKNKRKSLKIKNIWILFESILVTATVHVNFMNIYVVE